MSRIRLTGPCAAFAAIGLSTTVLAQELPLERITLYRSGVGAFDRSGVIDGNADVQLRVDADLVNDILKSMVLLDLDGGRIESASYGSREPLERRLASFAVDLSDSPSRADLLHRLRGTEVSLLLADATVRGRVLGVEMVIVPHPGSEGTASLPHVTLSTESGIETIRLDRVISFQVLDEEIRREIDRALGAIAEHRTDREKAIDLAFRGEGPRRVAVSYVHQMPVWKTSYRLVLPDAAEGGGSPFLQGWAIVENTTDEDWVDVRLGLVAGRPVGFVMDLYEPLFLERPEIPVPVESAAMARLYGGELLDMSEVELAMDSPMAPAARMRGGGGGGQGSGSGSLFGGASGPVETMSAEDMIYGMGTGAAATGGSGTVFRYELEEPVTIERRRSAMLPILSSSIEGRRVSLLMSGDVHPMRGVELRNSSGLQLMPGPISVYDGTAYAGDARIDFVSAGDDRFLSYAVDLEVRAEERRRDVNRIRTVRIVNGQVEMTYGREMRTAWTVANADPEEDRTIVIDMPVATGWEVVQPEPSERIAGGYRFEFDVSADETESIEIVLRRTDRSYNRIERTSLADALVYERDGVASPAFIAAIREAGRLQGRVAEIEQKQSVLGRERTLIVADQDRLRKNLAGVGGDSRLGQRYVTKLEEQETRLESIETEEAELAEELTQRRAALRAFLEGLGTIE